MCQLFRVNKKRHQSDLTDIGTLINIDATLVSSLLTLKRFHTFLVHLTVEFGKCYWLGLPTDIEVKITKHARTGVNHIILTKRIKLQLEKKLVSNLKSMQNVGSEQTFTKFIEIVVLQEQLLYRKKT